MNKMTLMLLLDAFRPDYLQRTTFLRQFAQQSATGYLRECFGFLPRAAYFGGLNAGQSGFTNMYCFDPEHSVFSSARAVAPSHPLPPSGLQDHLRRFVEDRARARVPGFAKSYLSSAQIPLAYLPYFDLVETRAPWDPRVGYESLFAILNRRGVAWHQAAWPETNRLPDRSDRGIVDHVLKSLGPQHAFTFVHLQELDGVGHAHGPNSPELQSHLENTDQLCRRLIESAQQNYSTVNVILFGDHGMVNVTRTLDLAPVLASTGLRFGVDGAWFLDSTMVRFWFYHRQAEEKVRAAFKSVSGGHLLGADEMEHFGIAGCDRRNGELIFLADPGVLLFPNFFQADGEPIKGMHGYDPDCADNLGFFLVHQPERSELAGQCLGKVNPYQIFPLLKETLGIETGGSLTFQSAPRTGRFTPQTDPASDQAIGRHMETIAAAVRERIGAFDAILLTGSFGRGEGGVYLDAGEWKPVNDYDLLVVSRADSSRELKALGDELAKSLGLDFIDLGWTDGQWNQWPLTVANYDLKYGSQVIAGDVRVLDRLPAYASAALPVYEAVKLLLNRTAGLLTGLRGEMFGGEAPTADQRRYLTNQIAKARMALGDSYLIRWGGYDASYRLRRERFAALAPGAGLPADLIRQVTRGYDFKLQPDYASSLHPLPIICCLRPYLETALIETINRLGNGRTRDLNGAMTLYAQAMSDDLEQVKADNAWLLQHSGAGALVRDERPESMSLRHTVYSALPEVLAAAFATDFERFLDAARARLAPVFRFSDRVGDRRSAWENFRAGIVNAWFAVH